MIPQRIGNHFVKRKLHRGAQWLRARRGDVRRHRKPPLVPPPPPPFACITRVLQGELRPKAFEVNAVSPGTVGKYFHDV